MDSEQIGKALITLNYFNDLFNISNELKNRIPEKHHESINDLIIEIENIAEGLMKLENEFYYEYLTKSVPEKKVSKDYVIEDLKMIENLFKEDYKQVTPKLMEYVFEVVNKIIEKE